MAPVIPCNPFNFGASFSRSLLQDNLQTVLVFQTVKGAGAGPMTIPCVIFQQFGNKTGRLPNRLLFHTRQQEPDQIP